MVRLTPNGLVIIIIVVTNWSVALERVVRGVNKLEQ
jgi:hypothetical protein